MQSAENDILTGVVKARNLKNKQKAVFLDRDGTINKYVHFLKTTNELELYPYAVESIKKLNNLGYLVIVVTNQPVIARGECTFETLQQINNKMETLLGKEGAFIDDLFFCPHHPKSGFEGEVKELKIDCNCRKPKTGMIDMAVEKYNIDLSKSWVVGDFYSDVQLGINAGTKTIKLKAEVPSADIGTQVEPTYYADTLLDAVNIILFISLLL
jgi:D-glycero-D-manno-heptose 1,7-bisphosphate phosphatase